MARLGASIVVALALAAVTGAPAASEPRPGSPEAVEALAHGSGAALNGIPPWAGVTTNSTGRRGWSVLNFYARRTNGEVRLYARYVRGRLLQPGVVQYADGASCPALKAVMLEAEQIAPPHLHNDLLGGKARDVILDGVSYELWGEAEGRMARTSLRETEGGPVSAYMDRTLAALQACWSSKPPP